MQVNNSDCTSSVDCKAFILTKDENNYLNFKIEYTVTGIGGTGPDVEMDVVQDLGDKNYLGRIKSPSDMDNYIYVITQNCEGCENGSGVIRGGILGSIIENNGFAVTINGKFSQENISIFDNIMKSMKYEGTSSLKL